MKSCVIDSPKACISETEIVNIATEFLSDGRPVSECRGYLLDEFDVDADDLPRLMEKAQSEVLACEAEFATRLRF